jgi:segregation and condensation protein A
MTEPHPQPINLADYQLRLPAFEGPLDLLLRLIERAALPISEVSLVAVTDQFLAYSREVGGIQPEALADFTAIGTRLVLLKSRSLLPRPPVQDEEDEVDDLVARLREYQVAKDAARQLDERRRTLDRSYARSAFPKPTTSALPAPLALHETGSLVRALRRRLSIIPEAPRLVNERPRLSIRVILERVLTIVRPGARFQFTDLVQNRADREETMTTFLATLVLVRRRVFDADQGEPFGPIELWRTADHVPNLTELVPANAQEAG